MDCPEIDERIYNLHSMFSHAGAFVDCRQCLTVIELVDDAVELSRSMDLSGLGTLRDVSAGDPAARQMPLPTAPSLDDLAWAVLNPPPEKKMQYLNQSRHDETLPPIS